VVRTAKQRGKGRVDQQEQKLEGERITRSAVREMLEGNRTGPILKTTEFALASSRNRCSKENARGQTRSREEREVTNFVRRK